MTILPSKVERDFAGIDTYKRGLIWSIVNLRKLTKEPNSLPGSVENPYSNNFKISHSLVSFSGGINKPRIFAEAVIPYSSPIFLSSGGNLPLSLGIVSNLITSIPDTPFVASLVHDITSEPEWVNTAEKYLFWCAQKVLLSNLGNVEKPIDITINEEANPKASIKIVVNLDLFAENLLNGYSYVESLGILSGNEPEGSFIFDNASILDNDSILGN